ncbi:hypothetical protein ACLB9X_30115 [Streptomyces sp. 5K101]|uniref:hypothetical protein n=1 Tax=Streptomyces sp. 5K101 TaxID=3390037 RepID=UPI003975B8D8
MFRFWLIGAAVLVLGSQAYAAGAVTPDRSSRDGVVSDRTAATSMQSSRGPSDEVLLRLKAKLGEPRRYCVDIPGYPSSRDIANHREAQWALEAHTCKVGVPNQDAAILDQVISRSGLADGEIRFSRTAACVDVTFLGNGFLREDAPMVVNDCSDAASQDIMFGDDGRIRPRNAPDKCLTIGTRALEAGDRASGEHWYRRPLTFSTCDDSSPRQVWETGRVPVEARPYRPAEDRQAPSAEQQEWAVAPMPGDAGGDEVLIQLATELGEPRHYCVDIPGYPSTLDIHQHREALWALEAHTCKTGIPNEDAALLDQATSRNAIAAGEIRFARLGACLEVSFYRDGIVREDSPMVVNDCSSEPKQDMIYGTDGRIRPALDPTKCLTVHGEAFEAGDRSAGEPWFRRPMTFTTCTPARGLS